MEVDEALIRRVAALARLELDDASVARLAPELHTILAYVERVGSIEVEERPEDALLSAVNLDTLRDDVPGPVLDVHNVMRQAPASDGAFFVVPKFHGDAGEGA